MSGNGQQVQTTSDRSMEVEELLQKAGFETTDELVQAMVDARLGDINEVIEAKVSDRVDAKIDVVLEQIGSRTADAVRNTEAARSEAESARDDAKKTADETASMKTTVENDLEGYRTQLSSLVEAATSDKESTGSLAEAAVQLEEDIKTDRQNLATLTTEWNQFQQKIQADQASATTALQEIEEAKSEAAEFRGNSEEQLSALLTKVKADQKTTGSLASRAKEIEGKIDGYETKLSGMTGECGELLSKIEGLLPGATSAGLAESFQKAKEKHKTTRRVWAGVFVACMVGLLLTAFVGESVAVLAGETVQWWAVANWILTRVPFAVPLIWLALHASKQHQIENRLANDFEHKETLSQTFEGYKRQLEESPEMWAQHTLRVLVAISDSPERIHTNSQPVVTPLSSLADGLAGLLTTDRIQSVAQAAGIPMKPDHATKLVSGLLKDIGSNSPNKA